MAQKIDLNTPADSSVTNAKTNFVSSSSNAGLQIKGDGNTAGTLELMCEQGSHGIKLKSPPHSAGASYTLTFPNNDGNADEFLKTDGSGGLSWDTAGGGKVLQVVTATNNTENTTTSTSRVATGLSASITPSATSSKVLAMMSSSTQQSGSGQAIFDLYNGSSYIAGTGRDLSANEVNGVINPTSFVCIDSPNTTSATTYTVHFRSSNGNPSLFNAGGVNGNLILMEIGV